ncbi:hypothetical protein K3X41_12110 [Aliiroseovarius crassostreae]|uniref:hypothetical protein n=1 Tax=Aliiroseovarius crassostreae TaxID=154981 RepID=UPI002201CD8B|nr:hypothetical protein [Aliiroseovarius crassostreae]UWQ10631.1 hypothetical protein K3X41_12110 [Aliiroseovarius crassostreae]
MKLRELRQVDFAFAALCRAAAISLLLTIWRKEFAPNCQNDEETCANAACGRAFAKKCGIES